YRIGQGLVRQGRLAEAQSSLERVEALRVLGTQRISALDRFMRGDRTADLLEELGRLCRETGLLPEARSWFEEAARTDPGRGSAREAARSLSLAADNPAPLPQRRSDNAGTAGSRVQGSVPPAAADVVPFRFQDVARQSGIDFQYNCAARGDLF